MQKTTNKNNEKRNSDTTISISFLLKIIEIHETYLPRATSPDQRRNRQLLVHRKPRSENPRISRRSRLFLSRYILSSVSKSLIKLHNVTRDTMTRQRSSPPIRDTRRSFLNNSAENANAILGAYTRDL